MKWIPRILALTMLWGTLAMIIIYVDPELLRDMVIPGSYLPFFVLLEVALWYTTSSFLIASTLLLSVVLTSMGLMHWGLAIVLLLTLLMESWYTYHRNEKIHSTHEQKNRDTSI